MRTPKFNLLGNCDDLDVHLEAVRMKYPGARLFGSFPGASLVGVGHSIGGTALVLAERRCRDAARPRLQALAASPLRRRPFDILQRHASVARGERDAALVEH